MAKKPTTGYENSKKNKEDEPHAKRGYVSSLVVAPNKNVSVREKVLKFLIYIALRLVIRPKKWKHPEKNYEIIDRTYNKINSADFIFIPSSIAFYIVMAFMPIFTLIMFIYSIDAIRFLLGSQAIFDLSGLVDVNGNALSVDPVSGLAITQWTQANIEWPSVGQQVWINSGLDGVKGFNEITKMNDDVFGIIHSDQAVNWTSDPLKDTLDKFIPGIGAVLSQISAISSVDSFGADIGSILLTLFSLMSTTWIAAGGMAKLVFTQSHIFEHKYTGGYWMNRLKGMFIVFNLTIFLFLMFSIQIYANSLILQLADTGVANWVVEMTSYLFLAFASFAMVFSGFLAFYKLSPRFKIKVKHVVPGAMVATIPTAGFLVFFGFITSFWDYGAYGIIGVMMYIGMVSLLISIFVFMGIITNAAYYKTFVSDHVNKKWTLSRK